MSEAAPCQAAAAEAEPPPAAASQCTATLACGRRCGFRAKGGADACGVHLRQRARQPGECPVCLCDIKRRAACATMACGHTFHSRCLRSWFRGRPLTCPMCRATCVEGLALLGRRLAPKLVALTRTLPPPPRAFFPAYIIERLESPGVQDALGLDKTQMELLVDLACECFTREFFFGKVRAMGL